uniref:Tyrosine-protein kinase n=1 Tax=Panagrolaimus sp. ES5 TaxID=591445 RepID=A0AC34FHA0_9BILA
MPQQFSSIHGPSMNGGADSHLFSSLGNQRRIAQMNVYKDDSSLARKMTPMGSMYYGGMPMQQNGTISSLDSRGQHSSQKVIALYGYESRVDGDISFKKDDIMVILEETNSDWWYVRHSKNGLGFVPRNFIAPLDSLEREEWFSGKLTRSMAEKLVSAPNLPRGTFLIRKRDHENEYALTINDAENARLYGQNVKHYRIKPLDNSDGYFITTKKIFPTIKDLVSFYSEESAGLCCKLTYAAPKLAPQRTDLSSDTKNNWEIPRAELQMIEKIGTGNFGAVYAGLWRKKVEVAIKTLKHGSMSPEAFLKEAQIMKQCQHPKLVRLYAVCTREEPYLIVRIF